METLSEFLKSDKNQIVVLNKLVDLFRTRGEWGKRGLFVSVASNTGFTQAYVGQMLTGKKKITDVFVEKLAEYFGVTVAYLRGEAPETPKWMTRFGELFEIKVQHDVVLGRIIQALEARGEFGSHELHSKLGAIMGFTPTFIGQVLSGKRPLTERFVEDISEYLNVSVGWLMGETGLSYSEIVPIFSMGIPKGITQMVVESAERTFEKHGIDIPTEVGPSRNRFLDFVKHVVARETEYWKVCHINWELLSLSEIESVINKLNAIRLMLAEKENIPAGEVGSSRKDKGGRVRKKNLLDHPP